MGEDAEADAPGEEASYSVGEVRTTSGLTSFATIILEVTDSSAQDLSNCGGKECGDEAWAACNEVGGVGECEERWTLRTRCLTTVLRGQRAPPGLCGRTARRVRLKDVLPLESWRAHRIAQLICDGDAVRAGLVWVNLRCILELRHVFADLGRRIQGVFAQTGGASVRTLWR